MLTVNILLWITIIALLVRAIQKKIERKKMRKYIDHLKAELVKKDEE